MSRFLFIPYLAFIASILIMPGCTAPAHLRHTSEPTQAEKLQQTIDRWKGTHISKAIQKWGTPHEVNDHGTDWKTYVWQVPVPRFIANNTLHRTVTRRYPNGMKGAAGTFISTEHTLHFTFFTRPDGIIYKTHAERNYDPGSEFKWK